MDVCFGDAGQLFLWLQPHRNICRQIRRSNSILALAGMVRKCACLAITLMTPTGIVEGHSMHWSM
jgi:hypothetical protein